jgi:murein hydrolase activator
MVKNFFYTVFFIFFIAQSANSQSNQNISQKNKELENVKKEIAQLEDELKTKTKKERESLHVLENLNKQKLLLNKLINNYRAEEEAKANEIVNTESEIQKVETKIADLKNSYSKYVVWLYKNRGFSSWRFIFDANSYSSAIMRLKYFELITDQNKKTLNQLVSNKYELSNLKGRLVSEKSEKENLVTKKINEQELLTEKEDEGKNLLSSLKKDKKSIADEIDLKRKAEIIIKNLIAKLVELERGKRSRLKEKKTPKNNYVPSYNYDNLSDFALLKGKLGWPVSGGKIVRKFGENKNERLKTVTLNYGIDLEVKRGAEVKAIAEGIVSAIDWIPGYGSVLIITHKNEFRTVYGHVANVKVSEGAKVSAGTTIAGVNESLEGNILHFEIWDERNYQNPEVWLTKR